MIPFLGNPGFVWVSTCILPDQSASFKRRWTSTWPTLRESTALHPKGNSNKEQETIHSKTRFPQPLSWTANKGKWREWSKIIEGNGQRPSSWICFCLDLGHHKEFLAERGINGAIFAVHQFLRLKRSTETLVLCESIIIHHQSSTSSILKLFHPALCKRHQKTMNLHWSCHCARSLKASLSFQPTCRLQNWIRGCSAAGRTIV